jgi:hypothetical protein
MSAAADLVRQADERLGKHLGIAAILKDVTEAAEAASDPGEAARAARRLLPDRMHALSDAVTELERLTKALKHLQKFLPYTAEGWPRERDRLLAVMSSDPLDGVAAWLQYWWRAAGYWHLDALGWLAQEVPLPDGARMLAERGMTAAAGLRAGNLHLAAPMLSPAAARIRVGGSEIPSSESVRQAVRLLLARLALKSGDLTAAQTILESAQDLERRAAVLALQAQLSRLAGDTAQARSQLASAQDADPGDLDVVAELIRQAGEGTHPEVVLEVARVGVDALTSLLDLDSALGRLLEPPPELWIAIADRASREGNAELARRALDAAESLASSLELLAVIAERRADVAEGPAARLSSLLLAGDRRLNSGNLELARVDYQQAFTESGDGNGAVARVHGQAAARYADCVAALTVLQPLHLIRETASDALRQLLAAQQVDDLAVAESWGYMVEVRLRLNLARSAEPGRVDQLWRAFIAAARAVALVPVETQRWDVLADAARELYCFGVAETATAQAQRLAGEADPTSQLNTLIDSGRYEEALQLLGTATDSWSECVRGHVLLRQGKAAEAERLLRAVTIDPLWTFAQNTFMSALLLTGHAEEAAEKAQALAAEITDRTDEQDIVELAAELALITGDFGLAHHYASQMLETEQATGLSRGLGAIGLGQVLLLKGDRDAGLTLLADGLGRVRRLSSLDYWTQVDGPQLEAIGRRHGIDLDGLDTLDPIVAERRRQLAERPDPLTELADASAAAADQPTAAAAVALGTVVLHIASGKHELAVEALNDLGPEFAAETAAVRRHLHDLADQRRDEPAGQPEANAAAPEPDESGMLRLILPNSWFDGHPNPVEDHDLFLRYLPEVRLLLTAELPSVRVGVDEALEPDGYQIIRHGELLREGRVSPSARYCTDAALTFLPAELAALATPDPGLGYQQVPAESVAAADGLAELLTMPAAEVVARIVGEVGQQALETG